MKKISAIILAAAMAATMSVSAFAVDQPVNIDKDAGTHNIDIKAAYQDNSTTPQVVSVDISWDAMEFTYTVSGEQKWNAADHDYDDNTSGAWNEATNNTITVTNHSNVGVTASFAFEAANGYGGEDGIKGNFSKASVELPSAVNKSKDDETLTGSTDLTLSGKLKADTAANTTVGTVTVTITQEKKAD